MTTELFRYFTIATSLVTLTVALHLGGFTSSQGEELLKIEGKRTESPLPPEAIASLMDEVIENHARNVTFTLVRHQHAPDSPFAWVCVVNGKPLWVTTKEDPEQKKKGSKITSRALLRARQFVAEREEFRGKSGAKERTIDWKPKKETLLPAYQAKHFDYEITEVKLIDRETESWEITFKPIQPSMGGEIWMNFQKGFEVSAEYGR